MNGAAPVGTYTQALEVTNTTRRLYISGQALVAADGRLPEIFEGQARAVRTNVLAQVHAAEMSAEHIVQATTYLAHRVYRDENRKVRMAVLGGHRFALIVVLAELFEEGWLLEVDAIAET